MDWLQVIVTFLLSLVVVTVCVIWVLYMLTLPIQIAIVVFIIGAAAILTGVLCYISNIEVTITRR